MVTFSNSSGRSQIDVAEASEIARLARGGDPDVLSTEDMQRLLGDSALVLDGLRRRPRYFDGRFLTGADLTRDQDYVRQRQADLARACGTGVVLGLEVTRGADVRGETLVIQPGHGVTPGGDLVLVTTRREVALLDLANVRRLDASLGLRLEPRAPLGRRTGLFILALRPVEFTANPIAAYPTSISGPRQVEDGDIIEATAITLIPYPDTGGAASLEEARRIVARRLFLGEASGLQQDALPLAMVALERGALRWIDTALVRRETGADTPLQVSMGSPPRAQAEAFVLQHRRHLEDVLRDRQGRGLPPAFAAAQYFAALPPAGQLPAAAILGDPLGFRQLWFPPAVDVDISFVPSDEVAALVEESLALPPIDLNASAEDLGATGVIVLAPVTRQRLQRFEQALAQLSQPAPGDLAQGYRRPTADALASMLSRRTKQIEAQTRDAEAQARAAAADAELKAWQAAWAEAVAAIHGDDGLPPRLWYVRRRAVAYESKVTGLAVSVSGDDMRLKAVVDARVSELALGTRVNRLMAAATPFAAARMNAFLGSPRLIGSDVLFMAAVHQLELAVPVVVSPPPAPPLPMETLTRAASPSLAPALAAASTAGAIRLAAARIGANSLVALDFGVKPLLTEGDVLDVASDFGDPRLGDGLDRAFKALGEPALKRPDLLWLGEANRILGLDRAGRDVEAVDLAAFATRLRKAITAKDSAELDALIAGQA